MRKILFLLFTVLCSYMAYQPEIISQCCTVEPNPFTGTSQLANIGTPARVGQTFMACEEGELISVTVTFHTNNLGDPNGKLILLEGEARMDGNETMQDVVIQAGAGIQTFELDEPYPVSAGQKYTWLLEGDDSKIHIVSVGTNPYSGGGAITTGPGPFPLLDLKFSLSICEPSGSGGNDGGSGPGDGGDPGPGDQEGIPTVSEWGLIMLGLCLTIFGMVAIRQKKAQIIQ